jgi:hypothetical protein
MRYVDFKGIAPKVYPHHLEGSHAEVANNVRLYGRSIQPLESPVHVADLVDTCGNRFVGEPKTIHRAGQAWVGFSEWTTIVPDTQKRYGETGFLYASGGQLWRTSGERIICGLCPTPVGICGPMEAPAASPTGVMCALPNPDLLCVPDQSKPTAECETLPTWQDSIPPSARSYVVTFETADKQESAPSPATDVLLVRTGEEVMVQFNGVIPLDAVNIKWYRARAGNKDGAVAYFHFATTPANTPVAMDDDCGLDGHVLDTQGHLPPPNCIEGVAMMGNLVTLVWAGKDIWLSETNLPHAYKPVNRRTVLYDIVRVLSPTNTLEGNTHYVPVVLTRGLNYRIMGPTAQKAEVREMEAHHHVLSPWGACVAEGSVVYICEAGLAIISGDRFDLLIEEAVTRHEWLTFGPQDMCLGFTRGELVTMGPTGGFMLPYQPYAHEQRNMLTTHSVFGSAFYVDPELGGHFAGRNGVMQWAAGGPLLATWRSRPVTQSGLWKPGGFKVITDRGRVPAGHEEAKRAFKEWTRTNKGLNPMIWFEANPDMRKFLPFLVYSASVHVTIFRDLEPWYTRDVFDDKIHRVPHGNRGMDWAIEVQTRTEIREVHYRPV